MGTCLTPAAISNAEESFNREIARNYENQNDGRPLPIFIFASFREFRGESISSVQHLPQFQTLKSHSTAKMRETTRTRTTGAQCQSSFSRPFAHFRGESNSVQQAGQRDSGSKLPVHGPVG
jgi:hypothetical protein